MKNFLKPDWRRIVLTVVIFIFTPFPIFGYGLPVAAQAVTDGLVLPKHTPYPVEERLLYVFAPFTGPLLVFAVLTNQSDNILIDATLLISYILVSYLLSCLFVFIYDRVKITKF